MTPMGVPVTVHMVVHVLMIVAVVIRRKKSMSDKRTPSTLFPQYVRIASWASVVNNKHLFFPLSPGDVPVV